jgi:hypothetical protein
VRSELGNDTAEMVDVKLSYSERERPLMAKGPELSKTDSDEIEILIERLKHNKLEQRDVSFSRASYLNSLGEMRKFFVWGIHQQYPARRKLTPTRREKPQASSR